MNRKHTSHPPLLSPSHAPRSPSLLTREALPAFLDLQRAKLMDAERDTLDSTPAVKDSGAGNSFLKCEVTLTPDTVTTDNQENWLVYGAAAGLYWPNVVSSSSKTSKGEKNNQARRKDSERAGDPRWHPQKESQPAVPS